MKTAQELNSLALETRRILGEDSYSPIDIFAVVNGWKEKKITIVKYPLSQRISGMCTKVDEDIIICINSTTSYGRQHFTLAHELYHILCETIDGRVVCDMHMGDDKTDSEKEADMFAGYLLMPYDTLFQYAKKFDGWTLNKIIDLEQLYMISHMALLFRLEKDGFVSANSMSPFKDIKISREAAKLGYGKELYLPSLEGKQYFTTGEYVRKVEKLSEMGLISEGKKEELLLDGFRADIVFNLDEEEGYPND